MYEYMKNGSLKDHLHSEFDYIYLSHISKAVETRQCLFGRRRFSLVS